VSSKRGPWGSLEACITKAGKSRLGASTSQQHALACMGLTEADLWIQEMPSRPSDHHNVHAVTGSSTLWPLQTLLVQLTQLTQLTAGPTDPTDCWSN
jgi:hypothetical protein